MARTAPTVLFSSVGSFFSIVRTVAVMTVLGGLFFPLASARATDVSAPAILQWFESSYDTIEARTPDIFAAGYGAVWLPPPGRADTSDYSVGYDVYDRFDLGEARNPTLYGTETGLITLADTLHRSGTDLHIDFIINHNGYSNQGTPYFAASGGYPGFLLYDPINVPGTDGDFHSGFDWGDIRGRLAGLIDIDHATNFRYIRNPVPGYGPVSGDHGGNLPAGTTPDAAGRLANVPTEENRRFYPDLSLQPIMVYDPATGEGDIAIYPFNLDDPMAGDPVGENVTGYLMRYAQWMVQVVGVDGFRIDAAKHIEGFTLDYFDRAVYRSNPRTLLDGSTKQVFSYSEVFDGDRGYLETFVKKTIDPYNPGVIGGNRDVLDFPQYFALRDNLTGNGYTNDWRNVTGAGLDVYDDGMHNGSSGVLFVGSHDENGPYLSNVAHAYTLMQPGNAIVYFNGEEFGSQREFPKDGRGDALGGVYGDRLTTLVDIRNTHGRGNYIERYTDKELHAFERQGSALVLLSNRLDSGYDSRTLYVDFPWGTPLIELTGNAAADPNIPELIEVFNDYYEGPSKVNIRFQRNGSGGGYLIYGLATPQAPAGVELSNVASVLEGGDPDANGYENGTTRLSDLYVIQGDSFSASLQTIEVNLLGYRRDRPADGDNALIKIDGGLDVNGNGHVDYVTPNSVSYGFEQFTTKHSDLWTGGDGQFSQAIDATQLEEGVHFITIRAFRHRDDGGPAVFSDFKKSIYVDRLPPESAVDSFEPWDPGAWQNRDLIVRSLDQTADSVHVFLNLPAAVTEAEILQRAGQGQGSTEQIDRDLFVRGMFDVPHGNNVVTIVTFEQTGTCNVQRIAGQFTSTIIGRGLGDLNFDGQFTSADLENVAGAFEEVLYSQNQLFNPAADLNGDGLVDNRDLYQLRQTLIDGGAGKSVLLSFDAVLTRRGDRSGNGLLDAFDVDRTLDELASNQWLFDFDSDGQTAWNDVVTLLAEFFDTLPGDAGLDGLVDEAELAVLRQNWHDAVGEHWRLGDFDGSGLVDVDDLMIVADNWQGTEPLDVEQFLATVPEPGTFSLLGGGLLMMLGLLAVRRGRK